MFFLIIFINLFMIAIVFLLYSIFNKGKRMNNFKFYFLFLSIFPLMQLKGANGFALAKSSRVEGCCKLSRFRPSYDPFDPSNCPITQEFGYSYDESKFITESSNNFPEDDNNPVDQQELLGTIVEEWLNSSGRLIDLGCNFSDVSEEQIKLLMKNIFFIVKGSDGQKSALSVVRHYIPRKESYPCWERFERSTIEDLLATREKYLVALIGGEFRGFFEEDTKESMRDMLDAVKTESAEECSGLMYKRFLKHSSEALFAYMKNAKADVHRLVESLQSNSQPFVLTPKLIRNFASKFGALGYYKAANPHEANEDVWRVIYQVMKACNAPLFKYILEMNAAHSGCGIKLACR